MKDNGSNWTIRKERKVYDNPWITLTEFDVLNPKGNPGIYGKVHFKNKALGIVALSEEGKITLVGQFRFPLSQYSWEIPEGGGPLDVDPLESAKRELKEETGMSASHWQKILEIHLSNSVTDEHGLIYLATGLTRGQAHPEDTEDLKTMEIPFGEALEMVLDGSITDSMTVTALLCVKVMLDKGQIKLSI